MPLLAAGLALALWRVGLWARGLPLLGHLVFLAHPMIEQATRQLQAGTLPLWNPLSYCGSPLLADPQSEVFNPVHAAFRLFAFPAAFKLDLAVDVALACVFTFALARRLGARRSAAALAGLLYSCGGFFYYHAPMLAQLDAMTWVPAVLLFWSAGAALPLGFSLALCYLGGNPVFVYIALAGCLALRARRAPLLLAAAGALALGAAAPQLLPALSLFHASTRAGALSPAVAMTYSVPPGALLRQLFEPLWNRSAAAFTGDPTITSFYAGVPALALALYGAARARAAAVWLAAGLVMMLGAFTPVFPLLLKVVPGLALFRFPAQWGCLAALGAACLAAAGASRLSRPWRLGACALVVLDLWLFLGQAQVARVDPSFYWLKPASLAQAQAGPRLAHTEALLEAQAGAEPGGDVMRYWLAQNEGLVPSRGQAFGLREVVSYNLYEPRGTRPFVRGAISGAAPNDALRFLGAGALIDGEPRSGYRVVPVPGARPRVSWEGEGGRAASLSESPLRLAARVESGSPGALSWADTYSPGWRVFVDGRERAVLETRAGFREVAVDAGEHDVRWVYSSPWFTLGLVLFLVVLSGSASVAKRRGLCYP